MVLDKDSRMYVTINTHQGLFRYNRLPFGIASAPAIFQRTMETILHTKAHANADALSRLPLKGTESKECFANTDLFTIGQIEALPVTSLQLKSAISHDPVLSKVLRYTKQGWPDKLNDTLKPYWNRRTELTLENDCIMWGI